jgi:endonuclease YncB( thermonuclease family)
VVITSILASRLLLAEPPIVGTVSVIDGDTIEIHGQRIRLFGIEGRESSQLFVRPTGGCWRCGQQASFALPDRIRQVTVFEPPVGRERLGGRISMIFTGLCYR